MLVWLVCLVSVIIERMDIYDNHSYCISNVFLVTSEWLNNVHRGCIHSEWNLYFLEYLIVLWNELVSVTSDSLLKFKLHFIFMNTKIFESIDAAQGISNVSYKHNNKCYMVHC